MTTVDITPYLELGISAIALYLMYKLSDTALSNNTAAIHELKQVFEDLCRKLDSMEPS